MGYYGIKCDKNRFHYLDIFLTGNLKLKKDENGPTVFAWSDTFSTYHITRISYQPSKKDYQLMLQFSNGDHTIHTSESKRKTIEKLIIDIMNICETDELFHMDESKKGNIYYQLIKKKKLIRNDSLIPNHILKANEYSEIKNENSGFKEQLEISDRKLQEELQEELARESLKEKIKKQKIKMQKLKEENQPPKPRNIIGSLFGNND